MTQRSKRTIVLLVAGAVAACPASPAWAQEGSGTEALRLQIRDLQTRLAALEDRSAAGVETEEVERLVNEAITGRHGDRLMRAYWDNGLKFTSWDGVWTYEIGGRAHIDAGWIGGGVEDDLDTAGRPVRLQDGAQIRRARLGAAGTMRDVLAWKAEFDFAGGSLAMRDVYLQFRNLPLVNRLTVGHFKEPIGLEELTSSNAITFMERSLPMTLVPSRNLGVMVNDAPLDRRMTWAAGFFREVDDNVRIQDDRGYAGSGRVTFLPWYEDGGRQLVHLGASYSLRKPRGQDGLVRYRARPEYHNTERLIGYETTGVDWNHLIGGELAMVHGPLMAQGEYIASVMTGSDLDSTVCLHGFAVGGSYILTGESRRYRTDTGRFDGVRPANPVGAGGWGAWEVGLRYSYLDLSGAGGRNAGLLGQGDIHSATVGLNWYLNNNVRLMFNYTRAGVDAITSSSGANIFAMRFQVNF